jgi:hypothetical protein
LPVKKGLSYLQMTLRQCRDMGRVVDKTEYFNPYGGVRIKGKPTGVRVDVFNFIDALAIGAIMADAVDDTGLKIRRPVNAIIAIQSCVSSGHAAHKKKILENEYALRWLQCGGYIELWSWRKLLKERGGKLRVWTPRIEQISLGQMAAATSTIPVPTPVIKT